MTPTEALAALQPLCPTCPRCAKNYYSLTGAVKEQRRVVRMAARDDDGRRDWPRLLEKVAAEVETALSWAVEHLSEPHEAPAPKPAAASKPAPKSDDRPACPACGTKVSVKAGRIRSHRAASGNQCPRRFFDVDLTSVVRDLPTSLPSAPAGYDVDGAPMRPNGSCHDCDKWLPAGRLLCGQCARKRDSRARTG